MLASDLRCNSKMETEIRITHYKHFEKAISLMPEVIAIGHEGCLNRLPMCEELVEAKKINRLKIILPKIPVNSMADVEVYLKKIVCKLGSIEVTVNDYGAMLRLANLAGVKIVLGRLLLKSFEEHPQADLIAKRYPHSWRQNILQADIFLNEKIDLIKKYNVSAIELNLLPSTVKALTKFNLNRKISVHGILDQTILAVFRSCPLAKKQKILRPLCKAECENYSNIQWSNESLKSNLKEKATGSILGILDGNVLMRKVRSKNDSAITRRVILYPAIGKGDL